MRSPQAERAFRLPPERPGRWWAWLLGVAIHLPLLVAMQRWAVAWRDAEAASLLAALAPNDRTVTIVTMSYRRSPAPSRPVVAPTSVAATPRRGADAARVTTTGPTVRAPAPTPPVLAPMLEAPPAAIAPGSALRPSYGSGQLWVRPLPMSPREMASAVTGKSQQQLADSVIAAVVQGYLDAMAAERADPANRPPSWVTEIGGKKVGLDGQWIYLGPVKLPSFLLGLLPINLQGNPTQAEMQKRYNAMREDLYYAARRAATLDDFKKNIAELRKQKQYEYDLRKAQRTLPDSQEGR